MTAIGDSHSNNWSSHLAGLHGAPYPDALNGIPLSKRSRDLLFGSARRLLAGKFGMHN